MPRGLRYFGLTILIALLATPQADARGGGGGGGGGFHGGFSGFHGGFRGGVRIGHPIARPVFVHNPRVGFPGRQPLPVARRFANNSQFAGTTFPWSGAGWWPVGDWGAGYAGGGYYGYAYPPQARAPAPEPQVIVISQDGQGHMRTAEAPADYSYVKGCHAIANGYHCDAPTATP